MTLPTTPNGRWRPIVPGNVAGVSTTTLSPQVSEVGFTLYLMASPNVAGANMILQKPSGAQIIIPLLANVPFYPPLIDERTGQPLIDERTGQVITSDRPDGTILNNGYYVGTGNPVLGGPFSAYVTSTGDLNEGGVWSAFFGSVGGAGQFVVQGITP